MKTCKEYRELGAQSLSRKMWPIVLGTLVLTLISGATGLLLTIFVVLPIAFSYSVAMLQVVRNEEDIDFFDRMFACFSDGKYSRFLEISFMKALYTFLWTLLFIIPGIVKSYAYAMTYYIAADNPELSSEECIHQSRMMMKGHKGKLFLLDLSYIGWLILSCFTFGILLLWVQPKMEAAHAHFYQDLLAKSSAKAEETPRFAE